MSLDGVKEALEALESGGRLTPEAVVEAARAKSSPLHEHFEWNDGKAAAAWRIEQARVLIRSVTVVVTSEERTVSIVRYVRDPEAESDAQGYVSFEQIAREPENARQMLAYEFDRAAACLARAQKLSEALGMKKAVEVVIQKVAKLQQKVKRAPVREAQL